MKQEEKPTSGRDQDLRFSGTKQGLTEYDFFIAEGEGTEDGNTDRGALEKKKGMKRGSRFPFFSRGVIEEDH